MTSILREVPNNFYYLIFYCEEDFERDPIPPPSKIAKTYAETNGIDLPRMLTELLTTLSASTNFEYTKRRHAYGCEDICSEIAQPHFHLLFYIKSSVGAKKYFKNTLAITLGNKSGLRDCKVMLCNVTYPENCLKVEMTKSSNNLRI